MIQFLYPELPGARRDWWLVVDPNKGVDLCSIDPGFEVDLYASTEPRAMTAIWMGVLPVRDAVSSGKVTLTGNRQLGGDMRIWLKLSPFAAA